MLNFASIATLNIALETELAVTQEIGLNVATNGTGDKVKIMIALERNFLIVS